ncbi:MAG: hypothetical protein IJD35_05930 [Clostridia bacterium]|nr:hypothetical protein [Clostridia bacterium]
MEKSERLRMVETMVKSLGESLARYEDCQKKTGDKHPWAGYMLCREDSRESMLRRITCIREQLLVLGEQIKKE